MSQPSALPPPPSPTADPKAPGAGDPPRQNAANPRAPFRIRASWVLGTLLVLVLAALLWLILFLQAGAHTIANLFGTHHSEATIVSVLRSEELLFLVTDRIVTRVDVEINEDSLWAGGRQALLLATVRLYVGIDLKHLTARSIHDEGNKIVVDVPRPTVLDFSVDPNWKYFDKRTGMWAISDWLNDRDVQFELRNQLRQRAMEFVRENQLMPDADVELARLNRYAGILTAQAGKPVEFRYAK